MNQDRNYQNQTSNNFNSNQNYFINDNVGQNHNNTNINNIRPNIIPELNGNYKNYNINDDPSSEKNKNRKLFIICGFVLGIIVLIFLFSNFNGRNFAPNNNGYTASYGKTLKVYEHDGLFDFEVKVLTIKKNQPIHAFMLFQVSGVEIKVSVKNNRDFALYTDTDIVFSLVDDDNNRIISSNHGVDFIEGSLASVISGGETISGSLFFYDIGNDAVDVNNSDFTKLEIAIPKVLDDSENKEYEFYYIELE